MREEKKNELSDKVIRVRVYYEDGTFLDIEKKLLLNAMNIIKEAFRNDAEEFSLSYTQDRYTIIIRKREEKEWSE